jgi:hypothetical protein
VFTFAPQHSLNSCTPKPGLIEGSFNPGVNGPGSYALEFTVAVTNAVIAAGTVDSPDGGIVAVSLAHSATNGGGGGAFQRNLRVAIDGAPPGPPQPVCLAS